MRRVWDTSVPRVLAEQLSAFADYVDKALARLSSNMVWAGRNPEILRPGQFVESSNSGDNTVYLQKPAPGDVWKRSAVRRTIAAGSVSVQASACTLNGTVDGSVTSSGAGVLWFVVVPTEGGKALEWVSE